MSRGAKAVLLAGAFWVPGVCCGTAYGQDPGIEPPQIAVDGFRAVPDGEATLLTEDTRRSIDFAGRADLRWVHHSVVWQPDEGDLVPLLQDVLALDIGAAYGTGAFRGSVTAPIYLASTGPWGQGALLGDPAVGGKVTLREASPQQVGAAVLASFTIPISRRPLLGYDTPTYSIGVAVEGEAGPVRLLANLGSRGGPQVQAGAHLTGDQLWYRAAAALLPGAEASVALELAGAVTYSDLSALQGAPLELVFSAQGRVREATVLRGGLGVGLLPGFGVPAWQLIFGVGRVVGSDGLTATD